MPCYDPLDREPRVVYKEGVDPLVVEGLNRRNELLEAQLCALIRTLERRGIAGEVIAEASRHGLVDIMSFWRDHSNSDDARVAKMLHEKFSKDEQDIVLRLLSGGEGS